MEKINRELLIKDICSRLPYGVYVKFQQYDNPLFLYMKDALVVYNGGEMIDTIQYLYLRTMSSMTEEEIEEYRNLSDEVVGSYGPYHHEFIAHCVRLGIKPGNPHECVDDFLNMGAIDWLNEHYFDYRGLIPMGLALEAPKGMYKTE